MMGTTLTNGKVIITPHYSVKVGRPNYSSEEVGSYLTVEFEVADGADVAAVIAEASAQSDAILEQVLKPQVLKALNLEGSITPDGALVADLGQPNPAPAATAPVQAARTGGGGGGGGEFRPPKASTEQIAALPRVFVDLDNTGAPQEWIDQRQLKTDGIYAARAADFKRADGQKQVWIKDKDGNTIASVVEAFSAVGVAV